MVKWNSEGLTAEVRRALDEEASEHGFPHVGFTNAWLDAGWLLSTTDQWTEKYFDPNDLHSVDRQLFID